MKPMNDRAQLGHSRPTLSPVARKRFRIEKLEERIAPAGISCKGHYNPQGKWVGGYWTGCAG